MRNMIVVWITIVNAMAFAFTAFADTGWAPAYIGSAAYGDYDDYIYNENVAREHPSVTMADERVDIYLHKCGATVNAEFRFVNDGATTTVDMFYPLTWGWKSNSSFDFELYQIGGDGALNPIDFDIYDNPDGEYGIIARWAMPFESGEEISILCRYVAGYGYSYESYNWPRWQLEAFETAPRPYAPPDDKRVFGLHPYSARYIIATGGAWKEPIGHGIIAFHTTDEVVWEDLINYKGKLHLNDSTDSGYISDETLSAFKRNDNIEIKIAGDSLIIEFDDLEAGSESFGAVSNLLEGGLQISKDCTKLRPVSLTSSASSTLSGDSNYTYNISAMGYSSTGGFHAWCEGIIGKGEGEWIRTEVPDYEYVVKPTRLKGIHLYGGFHTGLEHPQNDLFYKNGAPSAVTVDLYRDNKVVYTDSYNLIDLSAAQEDSFNIGSVYLGFSELVECDDIKVTIDKVRAGSEWDDTCISEITPVFADGRVRHSASSCLTETPRDICRYHPIKIDDGSLDTCWAEGVAGNGVGEWVELKWESSQNLSDVFISTGFAGDETLFYENNRPKQLKMELFSADALLGSALLDLSDTTNPQAFPVGEGGVEGVSRARITIEDVYPGSKYDDTCIAEIEIR